MDFEWIVEPDLTIWFPGRGKGRDGFSRFFFCRWTPSPSVRSAPLSPLFALSEPFMFFGLLIHHLSSIV